MKRVSSAILIISTLILSILTTLSCAEKQHALETDKDKSSYCVGTQIGKSLKQDGIEVNPQILGNAMKDAFNNKKLDMADEEIFKILDEYQTYMIARKNQGTSPEPAGNAPDMSKVSYCIGAQIGTSYRELELDIDPVLVASGLTDAFEGKQLRLEQTEIDQVLETFQEKIRLQQEETYNRALVENREKASSFLSENALRPGVVTLPDSIQYEVIEAGAGPHPSESDSVMAHYRGTFIDGKEFDSSYKRNVPITFVVGQMIPGWRTIIPLMQPGAHWKVYLPPEMAYGSRGSGPVPPNSLLIFEIEFLEIVR